MKHKYIPIGPLGSSIFSPPSTLFSRNPTFTNQINISFISFNLWLSRRASAPIVAAMGIHSIQQHTLSKRMQFKLWTIWFDYFLCNFCAGAYKYISELWRKKQSDTMRFLQRVRCWEYRQQPSTVRITRPSRPDKARRLGYKAKQVFTYTQFEFVTESTGSWFSKSFRAW